MKNNQQPKINLNEKSECDPQVAEKALEEEFLMNCNPFAECEALIREEQQGEND